MSKMDKKPILRILPVENGFIVTADACDPNTMNSSWVAENVEDLTKVIQKLYGVSPKPIIEPSIAFDKPRVWTLEEEEESE